MGTAVAATGLRTDNLLSRSSRGRAIEQDETRTAGQQAGERSGCFGATSSLQGLERSYHDVIGR